MSNVLARPTMLEVDLANASATEHRIKSSYTRSVAHLDSESAEQRRG